ncbi:Aste57867_9460 [Aphanomyces stellatus]|uniref:Aste57867_9460 protein n=1 Tax=Aphanomyces stellatus TaxID=120398 RepID=A0A485KMY0_9STRA|nr:hypothetical protein As57867_009424 [Aphanomyces stellatus]VFT86339.1 Aste57867_9460 [Aphanomyces stellatus]
MLKVVSLTLGAGVCGWIAYITFVVQPVVLFSWHPITLALAYLLATPSALIAMSDRRGETNHGKRIALVQWHVLMQILTVILMTIGFGAIYVNKEKNNRPHFTSIHSWIGCTALGFYYMNFFFGMFKTYGGKVNWQWKDTAHRYSGTLAFLTSGVAVAYGFYSGGWGRANLGQQGQLAASAAIALLHVAVVAKLLVSPNTAPVKSD